MRIEPKLPPGATTLPDVKPNPDVDDERAPRGAQPPHAPLALRRREAAHVLGISERLLSSLTSQGRIPHLRLGRAVIYPVASLEAWLGRASSSSAPLS